MIFSIPMCGRLADRTGRRDELMYTCVAVGASALLLLRHAEWALPLSLLIGLFGAAPAGVIMALTADAMAPQRRAFGMGVFFSVFFVFMAVTPPVAGWLYDRNGDPYGPVVFSAGLFVGAAVMYRVFRWVHARLAKA
jgi:MFS family permease